MPIFILHDVLFVIFKKCLHVCRYEGRRVNVSVFVCLSVCARACRYRQVDLNVCTYVRAFVLSPYMQGQLASSCSMPVKKAVAETIQK